MALSQQEFAKLTANLTQKKQVTGEVSNFGQPKTPGIFSRIATDMNTRSQNLSKQTDINQGMGSDFLQAAGQGAGFITDIIGEGVKSVGDVTGITDNIVKPIGMAILNTDLGKQGLEAIQGGMESYNQFKTNNPEVANNLEAVLNIGALLPIGKIAQGVGKSAVAVGEGTLKVANAVTDVAAPAIQATKNLATGVKDVTKLAAEGLGRVPARIATNVAEKKAVQETINQLPTQIAKKAVLDGVDLPDVKYLYQIPKEQKAPLRTLLKATQDFEKGATKTNPIEIVGKPIVNRIKQLETAQGTIGQKLGAVADTLGNVSTKEVYPQVFTELKKVNGLNGLKVNEKGLLDFTDTVLATAETAADRKAIQSIFTNAIKNGTGKQKHLLRQELFESLGGKKKSLTTLTGTQEKAYEAIRKGLSNTLDTKNGTYKTLNAEYAKVAQPLSDIRKYMKNVAGASEDILDMNAGLLARRLTSFSKSNPEIRNILKAMDNATKVKGKAQLSVENLQDFYNLLDRYYNIAGKTGFQGQVTAGLEKVGGIKDFITQSIGSVAGKTDAVKRKAIEEALMEALK